MNDSFEISIPQTLRDIKVKQWQKYVDVYEKNKDGVENDFLEKKLISIFCDVELKDINKIDFHLFSDVVLHLNSVIDSQPDLVQRFKLKGTDDVIVEFGLIPNFDKISYGEFIDLERYLFDNSQLHKAMAVLYRPIKFKSKDKYLIHDYKGTEYMAEVMKDAPLDAALSAKVFFYRLAKKLANYTMVYTLKELQQKELDKDNKHSERNGEVIKQYSLLLGKMLGELEKLQLYPYTNV